MREPPESEVPGFWLAVSQKPYPVDCDSLMPNFLQLREVDEAFRCGCESGLPPSP